MSEIVAEFTFQARHSPDVNQASGVSVRMTIANHETLLAATINSAKLIQADHELGTVEVGKIADLVITFYDPIRFSRK